MKAPYQVIGMRFFKGDMDGVLHDFTKLSLMVRRTSKKGDGFGQSGFDVLEVNAGDSGNYHKLQHVTFPASLELDLEPTNKGFECLEVTIPARTAAKA